MIRTITEPRLSRHARKRLQQRGIRPCLLEAILSNADVERHAGGGARLMSVSRSRAAMLNVDDRLGPCGVVVGEDGSVITLAPIHSSRRGKNWRHGCR